MKHLDGEKPKHRVLKIFVKILIAIIILAGIAFGIKVGPNYISKEITDKTNLVINYSNVTGRMKQDLFIDENDVVYLSLNDIMNYYDKNAYYDTYKVDSVERTDEMFHNKKTVYELIDMEPTEIVIKDFGIKLLLMETQRT